MRPTNYFLATELPSNSVKSIVSRNLSFYPNTLVVEDSFYNASHVYQLNFNTSLKQGEGNTMNIAVGVGSTLCLKTLRSSKACEKFEQIVQADIQDSGLLCLIPDPIIACGPYCDLRKIQNYNLIGNGASLVLVDWNICNHIDSKVKTNMLITINSEPIEIKTIQYESTSFEPVVSGTVILIGDRANTAIEKLTMLPAFEPYQTLKSIGIKRNRGSSTENLLKFNNDFRSSFTCTQPHEKIYMIRFKCSSLEKGYSLVADILEPLKDQLGISPYQSRVKTMIGADTTGSSCMSIRD